MPLDLPQCVHEMLHDAARVRDVPGIALRRSVFLHDLDVPAELRAWRAKTKCVPPTMADQSLYLHDLVAVSDPTMLISSPEITAGHADLLSAFADTFVALAVCGDQELTRTLFQYGISSEHTAVDVDVVAKMVESACVAGQTKFVTWLNRILESLCDYHNLPIRAMRARFDDGLERGLAVLYQRAAAAGERRSERDRDGAVTLVVQVAETVTKPKNEQTGKRDASETFVSVLTSKPLMAQIGSYHQHPRAFLENYAAGCTGGRGACVRIHYAIIHNDFLALRTMYSAYRLEGHATANTTRDFRLAMHVAACEGRLEILQWLHERSLLHHPLEIHCRPDTMAMAVRCGWADVVKWLHLNRPESAASMSELAINDAATWGHVDVLRVCHTYQLGKITETTMLRAISAGHVRVVQLIHSLLGDTVSTASSMDHAIAHAHVDVIQLLRDACGEDMDERRFALALRSTAAAAETMNRWLWSAPDIQTNVAAQRAAESTFGFACEKLTDPIVALLLPLVETQATVVVSGLRLAVAAHQHTVVKLIVPLYRDDSVVMQELLTLALSCGDACIAKTLCETGHFSPREWASVFRWAVANPQNHAVDVVFNLATSISCPGTLSHPLSLLADLSTSMHRRDALSLLAHVVEGHDAKSPPLKRTESPPAATMIRAIKAATKFQVVEFLLQNDPAFYTEDIVLTHAPACIQPKIVRFLLYRHSRQTDPDASGGADVDVSTNSVTIARLVDQPSGFLTLYELEMVESVHDSELNARVASHHKELLAPTALDDAARAGMYHLLVFVHTILKLPQLMTAGLEVAAFRGSVDDVLAICQVGVDTVTEPTLLALMRHNHLEVLQRLLDMTSDKIDEAMVSALSVALSPRSGTGAPLALLQLLIQQRPTSLHAKLAEVAAGAGSASAMAWLWSPESGVDTASIAILPVAMAAARGGHRQLLESGLFQRHLESEVVDVAQLRRQFTQVSDAGGLQLLLSLLEQWNPRVRVQLEQERTAASVLFGVGSSSGFGGSIRSSGTKGSMSSGRAIKRSSARR